jgi:hypothetical protein
MRIRAFVLVVGVLLVAAIPAAAPAHAYSTSNPNTYPNNIIGTATGSATPITPMSAPCSNPLQEGRTGLSQTFSVTLSAHPHETITANLCALPFICCGPGEELLGTFTLQTQHGSMTGEAEGFSCSCLGPPLSWQIEMFVEQVTGELAGISDSLTLQGGFAGGLSADSGTLTNTTLASTGSAPRKPITSNLSGPISGTVGNPTPDPSCPVKMPDFQHGFRDHVNATIGNRPETLTASVCVFCCGPGGETLRDGFFTITTPGETLTGAIGGNACSCGLLFNFFLTLNVTASTHPHDIGQVFQLQANFLNGGAFDGTFGPLSTLTRTH